MTRNWRILVIGAFVIVVVGLPAAVTFYIDWLWFGETGYQDVFFRKITTQGALGAVAAVVTFAVLLLNLRIAMRTISPRALVVNTREGPITIAIDRQRAQLVGTAVAAVLALLFGAVCSSQWQDWLFFRHGQPFGDIRPCARKRRRLLCVPAAVPGGAARLSPRACRGGGRARRCGVCDRRGSRHRSRAAARGWRTRSGATSPRSPRRCSWCWRSARIWTCRGCSRRRPASSMAPRTSMSPSGFRRCGCSWSPRSSARHWPSIRRWRGRGGRSSAPPPCTWS